MTNPIESNGSNRQLQAERPNKFLDPEGYLRASGNKFFLASQPNPQVSREPHELKAHSELPPAPGQSDGARRHDASLLPYASQEELDNLWGTLASDPYALQLAQVSVDRAEAMIADADPHIREDIANFNRRVTVAQLRAMAHTVASTRPR